jgi:hypothetical protein
MEIKKSINYSVRLDPEDGTDGQSGGELSFVIFVDDEGRIETVPELKITYPPNTGSVHFEHLTPRSLEKKTSFLQKIGAAYQDIFISLKKGEIVI